MILLDSPESDRVLYFPKSKGFPMTHMFLAIAVTQILITFVAAHYTAARDRIGVIGMTSIICAGAWLVLMLVAAWHYSSSNLRGWAPLAAFGFALVSFALFYGAYKLDELKQYRNTPAAS